MPWPPSPSASAEIAPDALRTRRTTACPCSTTPTPAGEYWWQLEQWLERYPRDRAHPAGEPFFTDPATGYAATLEFLGLPPSDEPIPFAVHNDGGEYEPMSPATREMLRERFREPNRRLATLIGGAPWWGPESA